MSGPKRFSTDVPANLRRVLRRLVVVAVFLALAALVAVPPWVQQRPAGVASDAVWADEAGLGHAPGWRQPSPALPQGARVAVDFRLAVTEAAAVLALGSFVLILLSMPDLRPPPVE